jgi:hypothetical protein
MDNQLLSNINNHSPNYKIIIFMMFLLFLVTISSTVALIMTPFYKSRETCTRSTMWPFVIICPLLYAVILINIYHIMYDKCILKYITGLITFITLWGTGELFSINCTELEHTLLYIMALIHTGLNYIITLSLYWYNLSLCCCNTTI